MPKNTSAVLLLFRLVFTRAVCISEVQNNLPKNVRNVAPVTARKKLYFLNAFH